MKHLIITADDFGLAEEVNEAVERAHRSGILSTAALMINGPAAADAISRARRLPRLCVGLHLVLAEGAPALPRHAIPNLTDGADHLQRNLVQLGAKIALRGAARRELRAEITAQFLAFRQTGLMLDHVSAHKHFHLHPIVAREIIAIGRRFGIRALRVPAEPRAILERVEKGCCTVVQRLLDPWVALLRFQATRAGLLIPDAVFGLRWSGELTKKRLIGLLGNLPPGLIEIYTHPAVTSSFPDHAPGYRYKDECDALCAAEAMKALRASGFRLGSYGDSAVPQRP